MKNFCVGLRSVNVLGSQRRELELIQCVRNMKRECIDRGPQEEFVRVWKPTPGVS